LYPDKDFMSAFYAPGIISNSGVGSFDENQLEKYLSDKVVSVGTFHQRAASKPSVGSAAPKDLETMLQLVYLLFYRSTKDSNAFRSTIRAGPGLHSESARKPLKQLSAIPFSR
jgi:zinc protease